MKETESKAEPGVKEYLDNCWQLNERIESLERTLKALERVTKDSLRYLKQAQEDLVECMQDADEQYGWGQTGKTRRTHGED